MNDFDRNHVLEQVTEDHIAAMVHRLTYRIYDPLSQLERDRVHAVAIYQARASKAYRQMVTASRG